MKTIREIDLKGTPASFLWSVQLCIAVGIAVCSLQPFAWGVKKLSTDPPIHLAEGNCKDNEGKECDHHRGSSEERAVDNLMRALRIGYGV